MLSIQVNRSEREIQVKPEQLWGKGMGRGGEGVVFLSESEKGTSLWARERKATRNGNSLCDI